MVLPRASAFRTLLRSSVTRTPRTAGGARSWGRVGRRGYASTGHDTKKSSSDLPWLIGSVAVTVPGTYWLLQQGPDKSHGHSSHDVEHKEEHGEEEQKEEEEEGEKKEDGSEGKEDDSDSGSDDESKQETPDTSDDEGPEGGETDAKGPNATTTTPDAKGGKKKLIESGQSTPQNVKDSTEDEKEDKDTPAASKKPVKGKTSEKQEGLSNTGTKHNADVASNPEKSKKSEGAPDSAKVKGAVDPKRPQK